jgi:DNA-binding PadR family transcriptional regulator
MEQQGLIVILPPEEGRKTKRYALTDRGRRALDSYTAIVKQLQLESFREEAEGQLAPAVVSPVKA